MSITGKGAFPLRSAWLFDPKRRVGTPLLYRPVMPGAQASPSAAVWTDFFFQPAPPAGAISGSTSLTFTPIGVLSGRAALLGTTTLTFATSGLLVGRIPGSGASSLTFSTAGVIAGGFAASGATTLTFSTAGAINGQAALSGASSLTFATFGALIGRNAGSGASPFSFGTSGVLNANAFASGAAILSFAATATADVAASGGSSAPVSRHRRRQRKFYNNLFPTIADVLREEEERIRAQPVPVPPQPGRKKKRAIAKKIVVAAGREDLAPALLQFRSEAEQIGQAAYEAIALPDMAAIEARYQAIAALIAEIERLKAERDAEDEDDIEELLLAA